MTQARLLLADPAGRWWSDAQLTAWADDARRLLNNRLLIDVRKADVTVADGQFSLAAIDGQPLTVGGLQERRIEWLPDGWEADIGTPVAWVRTGPSTGRFWPRNTDTLVEVAYLPASPTLPAWVEAGVPLYVCYRAYAANGPNLSMARAERWKALWERFLKAVRDADSQRLRTRRMRRHVD